MPACSAISLMTSLLPAIEHLLFLMRKTVMFSRFFAIYENDGGLSTELSATFFTWARGPFSAPLRRRKWSLSRYPRTTETTWAWLHEKGETDSGAPVYGCTCSGSTSDGRAFARAQRRRSSADCSSATDLARAMACSASQSVQISHGLPGVPSSSARVL